MTPMKPIRIEPVFKDRELIRAMFQRNGPYRAVAAYAPEGLADEKDGAAKRPVLPWFRGNWAVDGKALVEGAEDILHNANFLEAASACFGTSRIRPEFVVVNINAPMPAGNIHVDVPSFYGATRVDHPLPFLRVMGSSGLFEPWRVTRAGALSWFYEGAGGSFDYWPEGLDGPMSSERSPFGNVALMSDNDRMYHRIGPIGEPDMEPPPISAAAQIQPTGDGDWTITENGEPRAMYPDDAIRLSVLWKAEVCDGTPGVEALTLDHIMAIFLADLRSRNVAFQAPADPLTDPEWIRLLQRTYAPPAVMASEA